ncbi:hypothetical protein GCM10028794_02720 [Silanimonas algicola]
MRGARNVPTDAAIAVGRDVSGKGDLGIAGEEVRPHAPGRSRSGEFVVFAMRMEVRSDHSS